ncbi:MAG: LPS-assembly protein LptD [Candidatus Glassbacteria bacterium]
MAFGVDIQKKGIRAGWIALSLLLPLGGWSFLQTHDAVCDTAWADSASVESTASHVADSLIGVETEEVDSIPTDRLGITGVDSSASRTEALEDSLMKALMRYKESVSYSGDSIETIPSEDVVNISGKATLKYQDATLGADKISYDMEKENLSAEGETYLKDSSGEITGQRMIYNLDSDRGIIEGAKTQHEAWYFSGNTISKIGDEDLYGEGSTFTTCDNPEPHFHFKCRQLKITLNDKVIARPIVFYIRDIPFFVFPFYVFPIESGRKSGLLKPNFGIFSDDQRGRSITNLGYFWAASDYYDFTFATDLYERMRWTVWGEGRYKRRYEYDGRVYASFTRDTARGDRRRGEYVVRHNHTLSKKSSLKVDVNIATDRNIFRDLSYDIDQVLQRSLKSRVTYNKMENWGSYYVTFDSDYSLEREQTIIQAPVISITKNSATLFKPAEGEVLPQWYGKLVYGVSGDFANKSIQETDSTKTTTRLQTGTINADIRDPVQFLGWLNVSPGFSYREALFHSDEEGVGFLHQGTYTVSATVFTRLYGIFDGPRVGPVTKWRHTISPQVSYSFSPERRPAGSEKSEHFQGISSSGINRINLTLSNDLDAKYRRIEGEKTEEKSLTLARLVLNTSYNIKRAREGLPGWGDLSSRLESNPSERFKFSLQAIHSLFDESRFDPFLTSLTTNFSLKGKKRPGEKEETTETAVGVEDRYLGATPYTSQATQAGYGSAYYGMGLKGPWTFTVTHNLSKSRTGSLTRQSIRSSIGFSPSRKWRMLYSYQYDLTNGELQDQSLTLNRQLHRWEMFISLRQLPGDRFSYEFRVNLKDIPALEFRRAAQTP